MYNDNKNYTEKSKIMQRLSSMLIQTGVNFSTFIARNGFVVYNQKIMSKIMDKQGYKVNDFEEED